VLWTRKLAFQPAKLRMTDDESPNEIIPLINARHSYYEANNNVDAVQGLKLPPDNHQQAGIHTSFHRTEIDEKPPKGEQEQKKPEHFPSEHGLDPILSVTIYP